MVMIPKKGRAKLSLADEQNSVVLNFLSQLTSKFSPYLLACIPLTALIVVVWQSAATAQGLDGPEDLAQVKIVLDSIFLLFCSVLECS